MTTGSSTVVKYPEEPSLIAVKMTPRCNCCTLENAYSKTPVELQNNQPADPKAAYCVYHAVGSGGEMGLLGNSSRGSRYIYFSRSYVFLRRKLHRVRFARYLVVAFLGGMTAVLCLGVMFSFWEDGKKTLAAACGLWHSVSGLLASSLSSPLFSPSSG